VLSNENESRFLRSNARHRSREDVKSIEYHYRRRNRET